ncbi:hypothetical protein BDM02DRAFT_3106970 [Thelephora ganbajun]|uniref:Uncharacterized protein n=1 Tax=Thelephora ganbajun TaxID=370292 RepID=A0ACB6ZWC5_THEGA|nr:hypothetical protein BDM02DRAFT_3106970 [Thelephora ganbajun]
MAIENEKGVDVSLVLPQHRACTQPLDYRMNMHVANEEGNIKVKVCRPMISHRCAFYLQVASASSSDVTVWLPSDFDGAIYLQSKPGSGHRPRLSISPGFSNRILENAKLYLDGQKPGNGNGADSTDGFDLVDITTSGTVHLKMWDVWTSAPEVKSRETFVKLFGLTKKKPMNHNNWDFLLED